VFLDSCSPSIMLSAFLILLALCWFFSRFGPEANSLSSEGVKGLSPLGFFSHFFSATALAFFSCLTGRISPYDEPFPLEIFFPFPFFSSLCGPCYRTPCGDFGIFSFPTSLPFFLEPTFLPFFSFSSPSLPPQFKLPPPV